ncbi:hypothetical protein IAD21_05387 [Abditibacteriota bacterium]|nr:hypothetical protein IAD21_05387 [Abditibacteriota bacterium]
MWCIPPEEDAAFVAAMEDVLAVYARPYDAKRPVICLDEGSKQLLGEVAPPQGCAPGVVARSDYEYVRNGTASLFTASLFMVFEPLQAKRAVEVRERRTALDYAQVLRRVCEELYPDAEKIVLVQDNLNTHGAHSLYKAFAPQIAHRLMQRIEWHYTPKHGSWLNMAELELSVLARQCLKGRIPDRQALTEQVAAWQDHRNQSATPVQWHMTTEDARIKLQKLYPKILPG